MTRTHGASIINKLFIGTQKIREAWQSLPRAKHDVSDSKLWVFDIWPVQGLPDVNNPSNLDGVGGLIATVHGEYEEVADGGKVPLKRSFDRTFTLAPGRGPMNLRVVNDMMVVRAWGGSDAWAPELPVYTPVNEEEVVKQAKIAELRRRTGLNAEYAELCMMETGWDWDGAYTAFERAKVGFPELVFTVDLLTEDHRLVICCHLKLLLEFPSRLFFFFGCFAFHCFFLCPRSQCVLREG